MSFQKWLPTSILGTARGANSAFVALSLFGLQSAIAATGFVGGNDFNFKGATGYLSVTCFSSGGSPSGPSSASFRCDGFSFTPAEEAQFSGPRVNADSVELKAVHADGSTRTKTGTYDGKKGLSDDVFNLWIDTLFQRPLLKFGKNTVTYTLKRKGSKVASGQFIATVNDLGDMTCPSDSTTSWDANDCVNSSRVCDEYYRRNGHLCR